MHCAWPGSAANVLAAQAAQTVLFVGEHSPPLAVAEPAEQTVQLEQGETPLKQARGFEDMFLLYMRPKAAAVLEKLGATE